MKNREIIDKTEKHVRKIYKAQLNDIFVYHNLDHIEKVVKAANQIASHYELNELEIQAVRIAAWFHDVGYLLNHNKGHEEKSAEVATEFLKKEDISPALIEKVSKAIIATEIFSSPSSLVAKIVADADLFNLGTADFRKTNKKMWVEMKRCNGEKIPIREWYQSALDLLEKHEYHTDYCRNLLREGKQENINFLRDWLEKNDGGMQTGDS